MDALANFVATLLMQVALTLSPDGHAHVELRYPALSLDIQHGCVRRDLCVEMNGHTWCTLERACTQADIDSFVSPLKMRPGDSFSGVLASASAPSSAFGGVEE